MTEKETDIKDYLAKNRRRLVPTFLKIFNSMDGRCRQMAMSNPGRPFEDYCDKCQEMIKTKLEGKLK